MDKKWKENMYNLFFYANLCHVCKKSSKSTELKQCAGCKMIVYCSTHHQKHHWPQHKKLCKAIQEVRKKCASIASASHWTPNTMKLLKEMVIQIYGSRKLLTYEKQILNYPRVCLVCYKVNGELKECPHCRTVWFCEEHTDYRHDSNTCNLLKLCFESDLSFFQNLDRPSLIDAYMRSTSYDKYFEHDMREFVNIYGDIKVADSEASSDILKMEQSIHLTKPLTVLHGIRELGYIPMYENKLVLVFHIIGAHISEKAFLQSWELLLHIFSNLETLKLVLIGPFNASREKQKVCDNCKRKKKTFLIEWKTISDYVDKYLWTMIPDLAIMFSNESRGEFSGLYEMWEQSIECVVKRVCPLLFSYSNVNTTIKKITNTRLDKTINVRTSANPFACLKPNRSYDLPPYPVFYDNMYVNVYYL